MGIITLQNVRASSDITIRLRLKDGGIAIDWSGLSDIKAYIFSDVQRAMAGRCTVDVDENDSTLLVCEYSANKPQYIGVNSIVIQANYHGRKKTYDKKAFNIVPRTDDVSGDIVLDDPEVDLEISVEDVSSSMLENLVAACVKATEEAKEIADTSRGPRGYSAYEVAVQNGYEGTESEWLTSLVGPAGESAYQLAVDQGYEGTLSEWLASLKGPDGDSAYEVAVQEGFVGTKSQWLASLVGPQGLSAYQVAVVEGFEGSVSDWLASLVGPAGPPGVTSCVITVDNTTSDTPSATATVLNGVLTINISGIKGQPGQPGLGLYSITTQEDGTILVTLTDGNTVTVDLNHDHPNYFSKVAGDTIPSGGMLPDVSYKLGTLTDSILTFTLAAEVSGNLNHYFFVFSTGSTAPSTVNWPASIVSWGGNCIDENTGLPVIAASKRYEVSVLDGVAYISES